MKNISVLAVALGAAVDIIVSVLATMPFSLTVAFRAALADPSVKFTTATLTAALHRSPLLYAGSVAAVLACSVLAGAVAAAIAKCDQIANGACSSIVKVLFNAYHFAIGTSLNSPWASVVLIIASPGLGAYGGYLILRRRRLRLAKSASETEVVGPVPASQEENQ